MLGRGWCHGPRPALTAADGARLPEPGRAWLRVTRGWRASDWRSRYLRDAAASPRPRTSPSRSTAVADAWDVGAAAPWFVRWIDLPGVPAGDEAYAALRVAVASADAGRAVPADGLVALEQFDAAPAGALMCAFASDTDTSAGRTRPVCGGAGQHATSTIEIRDWGRDWRRRHRRSRAALLPGGPRRSSCAPAAMRVEPVPGVLDFFETGQIPPTPPRGAAGVRPVGTRSDVRASGSRREPGPGAEAVAAVRVLSRGGLVAAPAPVPARRPARSRRLRGPGEIDEPMGRSVTRMSVLERRPASNAALTGQGGTRRSASDAFAARR
ncbi:MAG: hypothetical protein R2752_10225 [Vicinamibacterales bacterium]